MLAIDSTIKLAGGGLLPRLGYGVYQARDVACENGVAEALKIGYKHSESFGSHPTTGIADLCYQSTLLRHTRMRIELQLQYPPRLWTESLCFSLQSICPLTRSTLRAMS